MPLVTGLVVCFSCLLCAGRSRPYSVRKKRKKILYDVDVSIFEWNLQCLAYSISRPIKGRIEVFVFDRLQASS